MKKIISIMLALSMTPITCFAAEAQRLDRVFKGEVEYHSTTPPDGIFKIEGSDKEFILLDDADGFFVLTKDFYGKRAFDPDNTQKFDAEDSNNIAYWLNHEFLRDGNGSKDNKLPDEIITYADYERIWRSEAGVPEGNCPEGSEAKAGIALLSQPEWVKYIDKFGVRDGIGQKGWWLRTPRGKNGNAGAVMACMTISEQIGQTFGNNANDNVNYYVRPCFYLKDEFFKNVKLDLEHTGREAATIIGRNFSYDDLKNVGYSVGELHSMGIKIPMKLSAADMPGVDITEDIASGEYGVSGIDNADGVISANDGDRFIYAMQDVNKYKGYELSVKLGIDNVTEKNGVTLKAIAIDENGKEISQNTLLSMDGTKKQREYTVNITELPDNAEFVVYLLKISKGGGSVKFGGMKLKEIDISAQISCSWAPMNVINPKKDSYKVSIESEIAIPKTFTTYYTLTYLDKGRVYNSRVQKLYMTGDKEEFTVAMEDTPRGYAAIDIYVMLGKVKLAEFHREICVMDDYDETMGNSLPPRHGINISAYIFQNDTGLYDFVKRSGFSRVRGDVTSWGRMEPKKGDYSGEAVKLHMTAIEKRGMEVCAVLGFSTADYTGGSDKIGPVTPEQLEGYVNYIKALLTRYPEITTVEIWNEPNNVGFMMPSGNVYAYAHMVKAASMAIRQVNPNIKILAGAIDVSKKGLDWTRKMFDQEIYPYVDALSYHPYYHTQVNDVAYLKRVDGYCEIMEDYGGWKDLVQTETGWTTYGKRDLELTHAKENIKILIHNDYLDQDSIIFNFHDTNEAFGMMNEEFSAKPAYGTLTNYNIQTANAIPMTKLSLNEDCHTFLYKKNGAPMIISWCKTGGETTITLPGRNVKAYDMYGNLVSEGNTVPQTDEPYYIYNVDSSIFAGGMKQSILSGYETFLSRYSEDIPKDISDKIKNLSQTAGELESFGERETKELINSHYSVGLELMKALGDELFEAKNTNMLHNFHKIGLEEADYFAVVTKNADYSATQKVNSLRKKYREEKTDASDEKNLTYELLRHAKKYTDKTDIAKEDSRIDRGYTAAWNIIAENLAMWAEYTIEAEKAENIGVYLNLRPTPLNYYEGKELEFDLTLYNEKESGVVGKIEILSDGGRVLKTVEDIEIEGHGKKEVPIKYVPEVTQVDSEGIYEQGGNTLNFVTDDSTYSEHIPFKVADAAELTLKHSEVSFSLLREINIDVKNLLADEFSGKLEITAPEGWSLGGSAAVELEAGETKTVTIPVSKKRQTAFNQYVFDIKLLDEEGDKIAQITKALDFSVIVKEDKPIAPEAFDGDISDWSNAYPTYLNSPFDINSKEQWQSSDLAGRIFTKWDENYLYILADVYDLYHNQQNEAANIWRGDSIQVSIDSMNDKSTSYGGDDYELGFAMNNFGDLIANAWTAPDGWSVDAVAENFKILRDDESKNTRYFVRLPKSSIVTMPLSEGAKIGMNVVLQDANLLGNHDNTAEITMGTATGGKNPSYYRSWTMSACEDRTQEGLSQISETYNLSMDKITGFSAAFSDINGHWAKDYISNAKSKGLVSGVTSDLFEPNRKVTVAEALQLAANALELSEAEYSGKYADVGADDWYAKAVGKAEAAGIIPPELISDGRLNPNRVITREEFAAVITALNDKTENDTEKLFTDNDAVSEWARPHVYKAAELDLMVGDTDGAFRPKEGLTRAEATVVVLKLSK